MEHQDRDAPLRVLIIEGADRLPVRWLDTLTEHGFALEVVRSEAEAARALDRARYDVAVLDVDHFDGSALAIADLVVFRNPRVPVIPVSRGEFFTDGTLLSLIPNACLEIGTSMRAEDLSAVVSHYGRRPH